MVLVISEVMLQEALQVHTCQVQGIINMEGLPKAALADVFNELQSPHPTEYALGVPARTEF